MWKKVKDFSLSGFDMLTIGLITLLLVLIFISNQDLMYNADLQFLYNRGLQIYNCISDGNFPYFYYNDFGGVGYGSAFFYGSLLLYPFVPLVKYGMKIFVEFFITATIILTYFGVSSFVKRFSSNYKFITFTFIFSCYSIQTFYGFGTYANFMGVALAFFFLARCIDFFRDDKSFIPASLLFFLMINSHLISAFVGFLGCIFIMLCYFNKTRLKNYIKFALVTCLLCSYYLINMFYHSDILTRLDYINQVMLDVSGTDNNLMNYQSKIPFGGIVYTNLVYWLTGFNKLDGYKLVNFTVVLVALICLIKRFKTTSKREKLFLLSSFIFCIISIRAVWVFINSIYLTHIQFPIRITPFILVGLLIIALRDNQKKWMKVIIILFSIIDLLLCSFSTQPLSEEYKANSTFLQNQVENGEYIDESFVWDLDTFNFMRSHVTDENNKEYNYDIVKEKLYVTISDTGTKSITVPKLYYKGYKAYGVDRINDIRLTEDLPLRMGYSQFIEIDVPADFVGDIVVYYTHPIFLIILDLLCMISELVLLVICLTKKKVKCSS